MNTMKPKEDNDIKSEPFLHPEQKRLYQQMNAEQKLKCALDLYETAWQLKLCGLRAQHPDWSEEQVKKRVREIFLYAAT